MIGKVDKLKSAIATKIEAVKLIAHYKAFLFL